MDTVRTFIALPLPSELKEKIARTQSELREAGGDVKWDAPDKFHITLKFLGDAEPPVIPKLAESLQKSIGGLGAFEVSYEGVGGFPNIIRPRVVWIGTKPSSALDRVQRLIEESCAALGFPRDDRQFHAHITLGRVKGNRGLDGLTARLKSVTFEPSIARCSEIHIMRSDLKPTGSVYALLKSIPLVP
ncbi:MAG TPA: RNA 2',3'-cyclic phosphodiesterase [Bacteroidetes bacterium]|nr:RNA 2',3'-cyclic phosphodiesterase [Bacteroidota bacterium]